MPGDSGEAAAIIARARLCIGTPFRLHGRVPGRGPGAGLDCVGLAIAAVGHGADETMRRRRYARRGWSERAIGAAIAQAGLARADSPRPGDVALVMAGADAGHLMILTDDGRIEAHAGIGRVVDHPGWPEAASWWRAGTGTG